MKRERTLIIQFEKQHLQNGFPFRRSRLSAKSNQKAGNTYFHLTKKSTDPLGTHQELLT